MVERAKREDLGISFSITTNGVLLDEEKARFIAERGIGVLLSLDGVREAHDRNRVDAEGRGTWDRVVAALERLKEAGARNVTIRGTFTPETVSYLFESHRYFLERYPMYETVLFPAYEGDWNEEVLRVYEEELTKLGAYYIARFRAGRPFRCRLVDDALEWIAGRPPSPEWRPCGLGDRSLAVLPDGRFRSCHRLCTVEDVPEDWTFGDVWSGIDKVKFERNLDWDIRKRRSEAGYDCSFCPIGPFCHGFCVAANWQATGDRYTVMKSVCDTKLVEYKVGALVWGILRHDPRFGRRGNTYGRPLGFRTWESLRHTFLAARLLADATFLQRGVTTSGAGSPHPKLCHGSPRVCNNAERRGSV